MIYDVSVPIQNGMPAWPSDPPVKLTAKAILSRDSLLKAGYVTSF